jgi:hypothetical protein
LTATLLVGQTGLNEAFSFFNFKGSGKAFLLFSSVIQPDKASLPKSAVMQKQ